MDQRYRKVAWGPTGTRVVTSEANWRKPLKWDREAEDLGVRHRVFCASLADVFEDWRGPIVNSKGESLFRCGETTELATMTHLRADLFRMIDMTPNLDWALYRDAWGSIREDRADKLHGKVRQQMGLD